MMIAQIKLGLREIILMGNCMASKEKKKGKKVELTVISTWEDFQKFIGETYKPAIVDVDNLTHPCYVQIGKDIDRTFPGNPRYKQPEGRAEFEKALRRVALQFPVLGYTQGVNFLVGFILLQMQETFAFKCFSNLAVHQDLMLIGLFEDQFPLVKLYCLLFWKVLENIEPVLYSKLKGIAVPPQMWVFQWFICLFIYNFPLTYASSIVSFVMMERGFALVRIAIAAILGFKELLIGVQEQLEDEFVQILESLRDQQYCNKHLPLQSILQRAATIEQKQISVFLDAKSQNWYERYFSAREGRQQMHTIKLKQLEKERLDYLKSLRSGISVEGYSRHRQSVEVMDNIEEKKFKRYYHLLSQSTGQRPAMKQSFLQSNVRYSLREIPLKYELTQSVFHVG